MNMYKNARMTASGRALLVERILQHGWTVKTTSVAGEVSSRTGNKWISRFRVEGLDGLQDLRSTAFRSPHRIPDQEICQWEHWRRERWTKWRIAMVSGKNRATVSRYVNKARMSRPKFL